MAKDIFNPLPTAGWYSAQSHNNTGLVAISTQESAIGKVHAINSSGATAYIQVFDAASTGAVTLGTTVPILQYVCATAASITDNMVAAGLHFASGIVVASTTAQTGNIGSSSGVDITIYYR